MFHRLTIIGFVGQDPSMRYRADGTPVTNFSIATRQVVSKDRVCDCPDDWGSRSKGRTWRKPLRDSTGTAMAAPASQLSAN